MSDLIAGKNPVLEALKAGRPLNKILLAKNIRNDPAVAQILSQARSRGIPVEFLDRQAIDRLHPHPFDKLRAGSSPLPSRERGGASETQQLRTNVNQGVLAFAAAKEYATLEDLLLIPKKKGEEALFCILDGIEDPMNLGAILRTAGASGVHGVIVRSRRAVGLTSVVAKASAGAIEYVPVARVVNIAETIETLKKNGIWVIGIDMDGKTDFEKVDFKLPSAIVVGSEGRGLSPLVKKRCDTIARIPMRGEISSLNASVAAALVLYAAFRQRAERKAQGA